MKKIKAFTMVEILIISILIAVWLFTISDAIRHAKLVNQRVSQSVIANQLATEWVELVYQLRNTNFLKYYYWTDHEKTKLNSCRLALSNFSSCDINNNSATMSGWFYYISTGTITDPKGIQTCSSTDCSEIIQDQYAVCLNSWVRVPCPQWHSAWNDESKYWRFYRMIEWQWIYDMSQNTTWWQIIQNNNISNIDTQEYRFCSRVARIWWQDWEIEICSTMTNFAEIEWNMVRM